MFSQWSSNAVLADYFSFLSSGLFSYSRLELWIAYGGGPHSNRSEENNLSRQFKTSNLHRICAAVIAKFRFSLFCPFEAFWEAAEKHPMTGIQKYLIWKPKQQRGLVFLVGWDENIVRETKAATVPEEIKQCVLSSSTA